MSPADYIVIMIAAGCVWPYACRVNKLSIWEHRTEVVVFNALLVLGLLWSVYDASQGDAGVVHVLMVSAAALNIALTYATWRGGIPEYLERPQPLPMGVLARVVGGRSSEDRGQS